MLGERLFPLIHSMYPDMASKITGMLLELDNSELLHMLEYRESLKAKVDPRVSLLSLGFLLLGYLLGGLTIDAVGSVTGRNPAGMPCLVVKQTKLKA